MVATLVNRPSCTVRPRPILPPWGPPAARRPRPSRVVLRRRWTVVVGLSLVAALAVLMGVRALLGLGAGSPATSSVGPFQPAAAHVVIVRPGDTLWSIATALEPHADVRPLVDQLSDEVGGRALQVGQRLSVP